MESILQAILYPAVYYTNKYFAAERYHFEALSI
jgi:hypothetical protein